MEKRTQRVIVVGGSSGIGRATVDLLCREGHKVAVLDLRDPEVVPRQAKWFAADVTAAAYPEVTDAAARWLCGLDAAVNCAGVAGAPTPVADMPLDLWSRVFEVNLTGVLRGMQAQIPHLRAAGGSIVNISSVLGHRGAPLISAYTAAKHALEGLSQSAALELAPERIRVNTVVPGFIDTDLLRAQRSELEREGIAARHPLKRLGDPEDVAAAVDYLISDRSAFITGTSLRVDGGFLSK